MHIKEMILEGFKSYAHRTVIDGFDPEFNAITGLNGSGKSNVLDAICFVLGISVLTQVRVSSLQELIYKQGQAGVTKASVTIVFDNRDKTPGQCPIGYDQDEITVTRQIIVGGRNKYLINGRLAQYNTVQALFHSVQLNVNNPHFLIMQGRITKVLNMKPAEILGLMEEAAGTRMFEMKKIQARKTIEKKDKKLEEIKMIIENELQPKLNKLTQQRHDYDLFYRMKSEISKLQRFVVAGQYYRNMKAMENGAERLKKFEERAGECSEGIRSLGIDQHRLQEEIKKQREKLAKERQSQTADLEKSERKLANEVVQAKAKVDNKHIEIESETKKLNELQGSIDETKAGLVAKEKEMEKADSASKTAGEKMEAVKSKLDNAQRQLQLLKSGIAAGEDGKSLTEALTEWNAKLTASKTDIATSQTRQKHLQKELKERQANANKVDAQYAELKARHDVLAAEIPVLTAKLEKIAFSPENESRLRGQVDSLNRELRDLNTQINEVEGKLTNLDFQYKTPHAGFDPQSVKGMVAKLIEVADVTNTTAVEVTAGGRLFNVIVDKEATGKSLLDQGQLKKRFTFIPLNQIKSRVVDHRTMQEAERISGGTAQLALQLVGYEPELQAAMQYIFGSTFVVPDNETGTKIAYSKEVACRAVTLQGDEFNPQGTMSGGAKGNLGQTLAILQSVAEKRSALNEVKQKHKTASDSLAQLQASKAQFTQVQRERDLKQAELTTLKDRLERSDHHQNAMECKKMEEEIVQLGQRIAQKTEDLKEAESKCQAIEKENKEFRGGQDRLAALEKEIEKLNKQIHSERNAFDTKRQAATTVSQEIENLREQLTSYTEQHAAQIEVISQLQNEAKALQSAHTAKEKEYSVVKKALDDENEKLRLADVSLNEKDEELNQLIQQQGELNVELKNLEHNTKNLRREMQGGEEFNRRLVREHPWIEKHKHLFGRPGEEFDFNARNLDQCQQELQALEAEHHEKEKNVNMKAASMFDSADQEYKNFLAKRTQVEKDKATIEKVIEELDEKKKAQLAESHAKVNRDFGSIFSTLLPGTQAELVASRDEDHAINGLEVRVAFGKKWKDGLSELSGGQRSLLALSLILALLLFKPAPMYILDEVDAALDLSHTQNIGKMLKAHFKNSQFIVVSLKEGMFNNANVLFRTKFINGQSTISRTENR